MNNRVVALGFGFQRILIAILLLKPFSPPSRPIYLKFRTHHPNHLAIRLLAHRFAYTSYLFGNFISLFLLSSFHHQRLETQHLWLWSASTPTPSRTPEAAIRLPFSWLSSPPLFIPRPSWPVQASSKTSSQSTLRNPVPYNTNQYYQRLPTFPGLDCTPSPLPTTPQYSHS